MYIKDIPRAINGFKISYIHVTSHEKIHYQRPTLYFFHKYYINYEFIVATV